MHKLLIGIAIVLLSQQVASETWMQHYGGLGEYRTKSMPSPYPQSDLGRAADYWNSEQQIMLRLAFYGPCKSSRFFIFAKYGKAWSIQIDDGELLIPSDASDASPFRNLPRNVSYIDIEQSLLNATSMTVRRGKDESFDPVLRAPLAPLREFITARAEACRTHVEDHI